ncbi:AEC family transporter [Roseospira navarrensis]|uniref:AEC family transporter n=1 Tax=Roseospira navarrensis TaxID=140058 RepID=A0A7X2D2D6_9PROT|nr:AEC family transporter [Roseospira navarrensis]MQX35663.1 AEC family transporter [Roseospira navarrensis]
MIQVVGLIIPLFGLIALGAIMGRIKRLPLNELGWLNTFVVYLALPALFFSLLAKTPVETLTRWDFILTNLGVTFLVLAVTFTVALAATRGRIDEASVQALASGYGNIGYMGPGLALLVFGPEAAVPVALIFCFENMMHFTLAPAMMALAGRQAKPAWRVARDVVRQIVTHPFIVATALGVLAAALQVSLPGPITRLIDTLANAAAPCALFAMGVTLVLRPLTRVPAALGYVVPMKLVVHPILMFAGLTLAGPFDPVWTATAVLLASLPTATNVFVIAQQYDVWTERASASILATTVLSVGSVTLLLYAMTSGLLPGAVAVPVLPG